MVKTIRNLLIFFGIFLSIVFGLFKFYHYYQYMQLAQQPISKLECCINGKIAPQDKLNRSMFEVTAVTTSGLKYFVTDYQIDKEQAPMHGNQFEVVISYKEHTCSITVPVTRIPVVEYSIGYPVQEDVKAKVYANGDLHFTGIGDTLDFRQGNMPWAKEEYTYVIFDDGVAPTNIDYWFQGNTALTGCLNLPKSIESMCYTFSACTALETTPEYFQCTELRIMIGCFEKCTSIKTADILPVSLISTESAFYGCSSLLHGADMSKTSQLSDISKMFYGCTNMIDVPELPDSVKKMESTFYGCSNIRITASFPTYVENIESAYQSCTSLETASAIPSSVVYANNCFAGCADLFGTLEINTDSEYVYRILQDAAISGKKLELTGNSGRLLSIQQDCDNENILLGNIEEALRQQQRMETEYAAIYR